MTTHESVSQELEIIDTPKAIWTSKRWRAQALTFLMVFGPGLIVMEADNDAGAVSTYVQAGAQYGTHLLWVLLLLLPICYFAQEMVVRLGIATGQGHAAMIYRRFGKWWGRFSLADLLLLNFLTLVTEFAAIALALDKLGVEPAVGVPVAAIALAGLVLTGSYRRWERIVIFLCLIDTAWFAIAFVVHPSAGDVLRHSILPALPVGGISANWLFLVIAIVGTTIAPWQLFFQQSCIADKRLRFSDLTWSRLDTLLGAVFTIPRRRLHDARGQCGVSTALELHRSGATGGAIRRRLWTSCQKCNSAVDD